MGHSPLDVADAYLQDGDLDGALKVLNEHLASHPEDDDARRLRIGIAMRLPDQFATVAADLDALRQPQAGDFAKRGALLEALGDWQGASAAFERAWQLYPQVYTVIYARALRRHKDYTRALEVLMTMPAEEYSRWYVDVTRGEYAALAGDHRAAVEYFSAALSELDRMIASSSYQLVDGKPIPDPRGACLFLNQKARVLLHRAAAQRALADYGAAEADTAAAEGIVPDDAVIPFNRGLLRFEQGDLDTAISLCREGWERANAEMRESMRAELAAEAKYTPILEALGG